MHTIASHTVVVENLFPVDVDHGHGPVKVRDVDIENIDFLGPFYDFSVFVLAIRQLSVVSS